MTTDLAKINLLSQMIDFALIDGELHHKEYEFLQAICVILKIDKEVFFELFKANKSVEKQPIKNEIDRIIQFYRLALLMHADGVLHKQEDIAIHEIGIKMGLNPLAIQRILKLMQDNANKTIQPEVLISTFLEQQN